MTTPYRLGMLRIPDGVPDMRTQLAIGLVLILIVGGTGVCISPPEGATALPRDPALPRPTIADPGRALTFAFLSDSAGKTRIVLVAGFDGSHVRVVELTQPGDEHSGDAFAAIDRLGENRLVDLARDGATTGRELPISALAPSGAGSRQIATGTNFPEHATEVGFAKPFFFPKFGVATPAVTSVAWRDGGLLDYEVEICARFDRPLRSVADFDAARKGFFLCGDFTDRAVLLRLLPAEPAPSGIGFSDAKSGPGFFPTGPFLVVPRDWRDFVSSERIATHVDGSRRQDALGRDMTLDFRALAERALSEGSALRWLYRGQSIGLLADGALPRDAALMSGTPAGVIFRPPNMREIACGALAFVCLGGFLHHASVRAYVIERYIARLLHAGFYLRPPAVVRHESSRMGVIQVEVR